MLRCPDDTAYVREDAGKLMVGFFEPGAKPWATHGIPDDAAFVTLPEDWDHLAPYLERVARRVPILGDLGIQLLLQRPGELHPGRPLHPGRGARPGRLLRGGRLQLGRLRVRRRRRAGGGRLGRGRPRPDGPLGGGHPAVHAVPGQPPLPARADDRDARPAVRHALAVPPGRDRARRAPLAAPRPRGRRGRVLRRGRRLGASELVRAGGRRAALRVLATAGRTGSPHSADGAPGRSRGRRRSSTRRRSARSSSRAATRRRILRRICAADIAVEPGRIVYTQWLNERGGIEADVTVTRLGADRFLVVTTGTSTMRDLDWLQRGIPADAHGRRDATSPPPRP